MQEIWKDIEGFNGFYQVSNLGNVKSYKQNKIKYLNKRITPKGYIEFKLTKNGKSNYYKAHRLVAQAFIPNPNNLPQVNHIDCNKQNNCIDNLEWCTNSENQIHAYKNGLQPKRCGLNSSRCRAVNQYTITGEFIKHWDYIKQASDALNIPHNYIVRCCRGVYKTTQGFIFRYANK